GRRHLDPTGLTEDQDAARHRQILERTRRNVMDDLQYGKRNKRGDWTPNEPLNIAPIYRFPWSAKEIFGFLKGYFLPWNIAFMVIATVYWFWLTPGIETLKTLSPGWILLLFARNAASVLIFFGAMELHLYVRRRQGNLFKYNHRWPSD